jgi:hypothetical protein
MDHRYAPPHARVRDTGPKEEAIGQTGNSASISTRARIHVWLASAMILGYAAYTAYWIVTRNTEWVWLVLDAVFFLAGGLLLRRSRWARHLIWLSAPLYVGAWLYSVMLAMASTWSTEPLLVDILMLVPGIVLVVCPSAYGVYVAHAYTGSGAT